MIIYRPHKGTLPDSMAESKEFNNEQEMKEYIEAQWDGYVSAEDIVIHGDSVNDGRIGWEDTRYVCTKKFGEIDNIEKYGVPQCIGYCATRYRT